MLVLVWISVNFIWVTVLFAVIMYFIANFMIKKFNYATPGRNGNYETAEGASEEATPGTKSRSKLLKP